MRYGFEKEATEIQERYLAGEQRAAIAAVPDALVEAVTIIGNPARVRDGLDRWRSSGVDLLLLTSPDLHTLRTVPELL